MLDLGRFMFGPRTVITILAIVLGLLIIAVPLLLVPPKSCTVTKVENKEHVKPSYPSPVVIIRLYNKTCVAVYREAPPTVDVDWAIDKLLRIAKTFCMMHKCLDVNVNVGVGYGSAIVVVTIKYLYNT